MGSFQTKDSSVADFMNQMLKNCNRSTHITSKIRHKNMKERKYFKFVHSVSFRRYAGLTLALYFWRESKQVDKTDLDKCAGFGFQDFKYRHGYFGEMHFLFLFPASLLTILTSRT